MRSDKITFKSGGNELSARLELPANGRPHNFALFAHCFTCTKNLNAVRNISGSLVEFGFGVLSFDFTGLGNSEGEFSDTNFSSNISDLIAAADFLAENYNTPSLIIGHSLGGAAAIFAAQKIDSVQAIATIGAPANPEHVTHLIEDEIENIVSSGEAKVNIGGRPFKVKKQFIDDLKEHKLAKVLTDMRKSALILHSPQDKVVAIENAAELYKAAHHPKSFISLDGADHLLSKKEDSAYAGQLISSWAHRYIPKPQDDLIPTSSQLVASIAGEGAKFTTQIQTGKHHLIADEPEDVGGTDLGPSPYQLLAAALGACTAMTLRMYADHKKWDLIEVLVHLDHHKKHGEDCSDCENEKSRIDHFERTLEISGNLTDQQKQRLLEIANKCPVHKTLESNVNITTVLK